MRHPALSSLISLLPLSAPAFAHGNHASHPADSVIHLVAHHWPLLLAASLVPLLVHLLQLSRRRRERLAERR